MAIPDRNSPTSATATQVKTFVPAQKAVSRLGNYYPGVSFRSALLRAQLSHLPNNTRQSLPVTSHKSQAVTSDAISGKNETIRTGASSQRPTIGNSPTVIASPGLSPVGFPISPSTAIGPTAPAGKVTSSSGAMALQDFPRPEGDNGRGMHWVPTLSSSTAVVDRFVKEAKEMKIKWMVILNEDTNTTANDYLVKQLVANGIMPVMRIYTPNGRPIQGDIGALVRHYRSMGVNYYQLYNEPNLNVENPDGVPNVDNYLDKWIPAAKAVTANGGLPGIGALAPGGNFDDIEFLKQVFDKIKQRGEVATLDKAWLSMHNYTLNHPLDYSKDSNGFLKFKWYDSIVKDKLGREMPIIGTEGGTQIGSADDKTFPPIDESKQVQMVTDAYKYMGHREPYNFVYTYWIIANEEGGGVDTAFSHQALFKRDGQSPLVNALKNLA